MTTVSAQRLVKKFGEFTAVDRLSFEIEENEIFGLLGPNGAGKSTTINMLCGILKPTAGKATVGGYDLLTEAEKIKRIIGVVPQDTSVYSDLTVYENIDFFGGIYIRNRKDREARTEELIRLLKLGGKAHELGGNLSGGIKRRLSIAMALTNDPKILFLDEPTAGIDAPTIKIIEDLITKMKRDSSILVTTHSLAEAEVMCDCVLIMSEGRKLAEDTPEGLREKFAKRIGEELVIKFARDTSEKELEKILADIMKLDFVMGAKLDRKELHVKTNRIGKDVFRIFKKMEIEESKVVDISIEKPSLVEAFTSIVEEK